MQSLSDNELVKSCLSGNQAHAKLLYERYKNYLARVIWNMENDPEAVQEVLQQTFIKIFNGLQSFKGESRFKTWITTIAVNTTKNHRSKKIRRDKYPKVSIDNTEAEDGPTVEIKDESENPQAHLLDKEKETVIRAAIDMLSDKHKETITLWNEGFSYDEIAEMTQTSTQTVGSRLHYAKSQLRKILTPYVKNNKKSSKENDEGEKENKIKKTKTKNKK